MDSVFNRADFGPYFGNYYAVIAVSLHQEVWREDGAEQVQGAKKWGAIEGNVKQTSDADIGL